MQRYVGTTARGLRAPIVKSGDPIEEIVMETLENACKYDNIQLKDKDIIAVTESLLARSQGNYVSVDDVVEDLNTKFSDKIGVVFPITSRNRFSIIMKAIAATKKDIYVFLSYPTDEVGNEVISRDILRKNKINIYEDTISEQEYYDLVGKDYSHHFTGVNYVSLYKSLGVDDNVKIFLTNNYQDILKYTDEILICNIHDRDHLKEDFKELGAKAVYNLSDIMNKPINGSGYNAEYGLYGSNLSSDTKLKLFPRDSQKFVEDLQKKLCEKYNKKIEVMVYGDGAFKDPVGKIWELADPVVSPGFTDGLIGTPNELKIKYIADTELADADKEQAENLMKERINKKEDNLVGKNESLGTTPRQLTDLLGSLSDLISGSGDKGTPIVLIQGYFDNYATE